MSKSRNSAAYYIIIAVMFLGPAGMFFTPFPAAGSFRNFYILLPFLIILSLLRLRVDKSNGLPVLLAILLIIVASSSYATIIASDRIESLASNPIVRAVVIVNLAIGFYFMALWIAKRGDGQYLNKAVDISFLGFSLVFILGLALYFLYVRGVIGAEQYARFTSLYQEGYGYVRLSPGTYPNEFGILCSFYALYAIYIYGRRGKVFYLFLFLLFCTGVFLATTRTAYITLGIGLLFLIFSPESKAFERLKYISVTLVAIFVLSAIFAFIDFDIMGVLESGYESARAVQGGVGTRLEMWDVATDSFFKAPFFGLGFESPDVKNLHNVPLQLLYGLGVLPLALVILLFFIFFISMRQNKNIRSVCFNDKDSLEYAKRIRFLLGIHVFVFALTNHNQAHFFTWLLFMLCCLHYRRERVLMTFPVKTL